MDLDVAAGGADTCGMLFCAEKSEHLPIGRKTKVSQRVFMQGIPVPEVRSHRHLGLMMSDSLSWKDHIQGLYTVCARMIGVLRRLGKRLAPEVMKKIYTAIIRPRLEYACAVWSGGSTLCLQRLQDSFAKRHAIVLPPLEKRFKYHTLVLFYRIRSNLAPAHLSSILPPLTSSTSGYPFRKLSYPVPYTRKSSTLASFLPRAIILWNALPKEIQLSKSLSLFKKELRAHFYL